MQKKKKKEKKGVICQFLTKYIKVVTEKEKKRKRQIEEGIF